MTRMPRFLAQIPATALVYLDAPDSPAARAAFDALPATRVQVAADAEDGTSGPVVASVRLTDDTTTHPPTIVQVSEHSCRTPACDGDSAQTDNGARDGLCPDCAEQRATGAAV